MSSNVEQIKDRLGVVEVLEGYLKLEKAGKNFKARCPFHNEKTPSFFVSPERNSYYCFGCEAKGDIFSFVQEFEGLDFMGALKMLADRAGVTLDRSHPANREAAHDPHDRIYAAVREACEFFERTYKSTPAAQEYVASRGITPETVAAFSIGYAPADWRKLFDHLREQGFTEAEMLEAGLIKRKDSSGGSEQAEAGKSSQPYDVFRNRIMFPVRDTSGRLVAFSGRFLGKDDEFSPKYLNSPETPIFKKSETLYGFDKAKLGIRKVDFSILVEGQVDLVMAHQCGFTNTVAVMGTAFTASHARKLKRFSGNLALALDADSAGIASALRTSRVALMEGLETKIVALPAGMDPADVLTKDKNIWTTSIREARHVIDFLTDTVISEESDERKLKQRIQREVFPFIKLIKNGIDRAHFVAKIAHVLTVDESVVEAELEKIPAERTESAPPAPESAPAAEAPLELTKQDRLVRLLAGLFVWQSGAGESPVPNFAERFERIAGARVENLYSDAEREALGFEAEVAYAGSEKLAALIEEMLSSAEEESLKKQFAALMHELKQLERAGKELESLEVLAKCRHISRQLDELKNSRRTT